MDHEKSSSMIQSLQVGMSIIDLIASQEQPLRFSEIQELTQITKSNKIIDPNTRRLFAGVHLNRT